LLVLNEFENPRNKFKIGEHVLLGGYLGRIFEVIKFTHKTSFANGKLDDVSAYVLKDIKSNETLIGFPVDMKKYTNKDKAEEEDRFNAIVDAALDKYNTDIYLFGLFGDQEYKDDADNIIQLLKEFVDERDDK